MNNSTKNPKCWQSSASCSSGFAQWWDSHSNEAMSNKAWAKCAWEAARDRTAAECREYLDKEVKQLKKEGRSEKWWIAGFCLLVGGGAVIATIFGL